MLDIKFIKNTHFKPTEIGKLPEEWEVVRLGDVAEKIKAGGTPLTNVKEYWENGDIPLVKVEDVVNADKFIVQTNLSITKKGLNNSSAWLVPENSIILTMYGTPGEVAINKVPVAVTQNVMGIIKTKDIDTDFFYYALKYAKNYTLHLIADRTIFSHFTLAKGKNLIFPLPPLEEQKRIAFVLSTIQTAKEKTEKVIQATKELKKSMMNHLFTYGPVSLEEAEKVKLKETEIGMMPKEWEVVPLGEIANVKYGKANPKDKGDIPVVGSGGIYSGTTKALLDKPTIVIGRKGTAGKSWLMLEPCYPSDTTFYLDWKKEVDVKFIFNYMVLRPLSGEHAKTTLPSLQKPELDKMKLPLPRLPTQQKIASILSAIDEKIQAEENKKKALEELFKSMLHNLMTAKIRVKDLKLGVKYECD